MDDMFRAASSMADSLRFKPYDSDHNAWTSRFGMTMFEYYRKYPAKATRFARGMEGAARCKSGPVVLFHLSPKFLAKCSGPTGFGAGRRL